MEKIEKATEQGDVSTLDKMNRRNVKVTTKHNDDCKKLLSLMGVPWIQAPSEAEAQCAALVKEGYAFAAASEDMDTLTFGSNILLRHLTLSEAKKMPIVEIHLDKVLSGLSLSMNQFVDLCILLGCDYCDNIKGIGPVKALNLIKTLGSLENILPSLDNSKYNIPEDFQFQKVRELFTNHNVLKRGDESLDLLKWGLPDSEGLLSFMVKQNGFSEQRIKISIAKIVKAKNTAPQGRLDSFFKVTTETSKNRPPKNPPKTGKNNKSRSSKK